MGRAGLEPARAIAHQILSLARLPIPPPAHQYRFYIAAVGGRPIRLPSHETDFDFIKVTDEIISQIQLPVCKCFRYGLVY